MGTDVTLHAFGVGAGAVRDARKLVERLEQRWTRFDARSELRRLNAAAGRPVVVSRATAVLLELAVSAYGWTDGYFDVTVGHAMDAFGYDRSFELLDGASRVGTDVVRPPGSTDIEVDVSTGLVSVPAGLALDFGGLAKGHTADLVVEQLRAGGATGACADLGGDARVIGAPADSPSWRVVVDDPFRPGADLAAFALPSGAVATSSTRRRRWTDGEHEANHLVDTRTGRPASGGVVAATAVAGTAAVAEIAAKVALLAPVDRAAPLLERLGSSALVVREDETTVLLAGMEALIA
jgi:thiamine biosynthesis lipoprotein